MNTQIKVRNIKTISDISIAAEILIKLLGGSSTVKLKIPLDMIYDGNTGTIDFAEVFVKDTLDLGKVRDDMRIPDSPDCSDAMKPTSIGDDQEHIGE